MYSFSYLEPVYCSMSSSNCCFLTCIQISQEAGQVVWYSHLFQNFPQFIVIHTVIRKLLELISEFSKVAGYKTNTQKSLSFIYTKNEKSEREIKESIPFTTAKKELNI